MYANDCIFMNLTGMGCRFCCPIGVPIPAGVTSKSLPRPVFFVFLKFWHTSQATSPPLAKRRVKHSLGTCVHYSYPLCCGLYSVFRTRAEVPNGNFAQEFLSNPRSWRGSQQRFALDA